MKCDKLNAYKGDVTIPVYGTIADAEVYLKSEADKVIAELKEERRWRKFSEEKPELGDVVLVKLSERVKGHYFPMDVVRWDSSYELGEIEVSHWMPLPSDPKEANK